MQKKIALWNNKIHTKQLTKAEVWLSLRIVLYKTLAYPLTAMHSTKRECHSLDTQVLKTALPALGIPISFPRTLVHAPTDVQGLGVPLLWHLQGIKHVSTILEHIQPGQTTITGTLLQDVVAGMKDFTKMSKCITPTHFHTTWQFCWEAKIY